MAKRKKSDTVQLKLRIRERLRQRLQIVAEKADHSLNAEMVQRLEQSFLMDKNASLIEALLGSGEDLELLRAIAIMLRSLNGRWRTDKQNAENLATAVAKIISVFRGDIEPTESAFPKRAEFRSADLLVWLAIATEGARQRTNREIKGERQ